MVRCYARQVTWPPRMAFIQLSATPPDGSITYDILRRSVSTEQVTNAHRGGEKWFGPHGKDKSTNTGNMFLTRRGHEMYDLEPINTENSIAPALCCRLVSAWTFSCYRDQTKQKRQPAACHNKLVTVLRYLVLLLSVKVAGESICVYVLRHNNGW